MRQALLAKPTRKWPRCHPRPGGVAASPTLLGPVLVWNKQNYLKLLLTRRYTKLSYGCCPATSLEQKRAWKWMKWITFTLVYSPAWASQKFFKGWGKVDILLILFRLLTMPSTWTLTKPLPFQHYKGNAPCCGNSPKKYPSLTGMLLFHSCVFSHRRKLRG